MIGQLLGMLSYHELFGFLPGDLSSDSYVWVVWETNVLRTLCEDPAVFLEDDEQWCEPQSDTIGRVQPLLLTILRFRARIGLQLPTRRHNFDAGQRLDAGEIRHAGHEVDIVIGPRRGFRQQTTES
jgi:hypothetical protein